MEIACDNIDKLINIEMRRTGLPRGKKWVLWEVARELSREPLVLAAARLLNREANRPRSPASTICSSPSSGSAATATASSTA